MRYDKDIYFVSVGEEYDSTTGDYTERVTAREARKASVMDTQADTLLLVYGAIKQGSLTIQLQNHFDGAFNYIEYSGKKYAVDRRRTLRHKETFIVSELQ